MGDINQESVNRICSFFSNCVFDKIETVHFLIHSLGGFVSDGIFLHNYLSNLPLKLITYNAGNVSSIAVIVFLAGQERCSAESATFMLHNPHVSAAPQTITAELIQIAASLDLDDTRTNAILIKFTNNTITIPTIGNITLSATDALKAGLVSKILQFSPPAHAILRHITPLTHQSSRPLKRRLISNVRGK